MFQKTVKEFNLILSSVNILYNIVFLKQFCGNWHRHSPFYFKQLTINNDCSLVDNQKIIYIMASEVNQENMSYFFVVFFISIRKKLFFHCSLFFQDAYDTK